MSGRTDVKLLDPQEKKSWSIILRLQNMKAAAVNRKIERSNLHKYGDWRGGTTQPEAKVVFPVVISEYFKYSSFHE